MNFIKSLLVRIIGVIMLIIGIHCFLEGLTRNIVGLPAGLIFCICGLYSTITGKDPNTLTNGNYNKRKKPSHEHLKKQMHEDFIRNQQEFTQWSSDQNVNDLKSHMDTSNNFSNEMNNNNMHNNF